MEPWDLQDSTVVVKLGRMGMKLVSYVAPKRATEQRLAYKDQVISAAPFGWREHSISIVAIPYLRPAAYLFRTLVTFGVKYGGVVITVSTLHNTEGGENQISLEES